MTKKLLLKATRPGEFEAIVTMLEQLLDEGHTIELRTQDAEDSDEFPAHRVYVVTVTNEDGDTISGGESALLVDALEDAYGSTPEAADTDDTAAGIVIPDDGGDE